MAAAEASGVSANGGAARMRLMCSHGGRFTPCDPDGGLRYVGGETRVLVLPREASFRELTAKLGDMAGKTVSAVRYRLVDDGLSDVLVTVTGDDELAHMCDEHDRLKATRPSACFRVFFSGVQRRARPGLPPLPPKIRRVQSEPVIAAERRPPMRRVQSAHQLAGRQPCCHPAGGLSYGCR